MLGPPKPRRLDEPIAVSLEALVPTDHFYRHLDRCLDLGFVRELVRAAYADRGRPGVDPVVFFKLQLVMFFEGVRSERQLLRLAADRLSVRWYLGYGIDEPLPDHSSLSRIRARYGLTVFRRFFEEVIERCVQAGLVWGRELYVDGTMVEANAAVDSMRPRFTIEAHLADLFAGAPPEPLEAAAGPSRPAPAPLPLELTEEARAALSERAAGRHGWLDHDGRPDRSRTSGPYRRTADYRASPTDPDASPLRPTGGRARLGYHVHYVVDGGRARTVLAALVTPAEVQDNQPMLDLLWHARFRWKLRLRQATGDTKYGTVENVVGIENQGIRAYVPLPDVEARKPGFFGTSAFTYDRTEDLFRCPGGEELPFRKHRFDVRLRVYQAPAAACNACGLKPRCTGGTTGRQVARHLDEAYLDRVRGYREIEAYQKAIRKRKVWVEPLFAEAKDWHGLRRFRLRGLRKVNGEALLVAAGQNLKRLLSHRGWGRRPWPGGGAGLVLPVVLPAPAGLG